MPVFIKLFWCLFWFGMGVAAIKEPGFIPWGIGLGISCFIYGKGKQEFDRDMAGDDSDKHEQGSYKP